MRTLTGKLENVEYFDASRYSKLKGNMMLINIRFFKYDTDAEDVDIVECDEGEFLELVEQGFKIEYHRHTVRDNGCSQVCLTVDNLGYY